MFSVYVEDKNGLNKTCIFHDESIDLALKLISPQLELEDNSAGSFQFTMYPSNQGYGLIPDTTTDHVSILSSTVRIYREWTTPSETPDNPPYWHKEEIWEGRPLTEDKDFYNARVIYCEGAFSYLNDICQPVKEYLGANDGDIELIDYVNGVLAEYNKHAASNRQFDISKTYVNPIGISSLCTLKDPVASVDLLPTGDGSGTKDYDIRQIGDTTSKVYYMYTTLTGWKDASKSIYHTMGSYYKTGGETTKDAIGVLVSAFGGHVKVVTVGSSRCLYYTANADPEDAYLYPEGTYPETDRGLQQEVVFGKNLLDLSKKKDGSKFFTVLLPVGAEIGSTNETVTSMCPSFLEDGSVIRGNGAVYAHCDLGVDNEIAPFDSVSTHAVFIRTEVNSQNPIKRKVIGFDIPQELNGYDFFLNTTTFLRSETNSTDAQNTYYYTMTDRSAEDSTISIIGENSYYPGKGMGYGVGVSGMSNPYWSSGIYSNHRPIIRKKMGQNTYIRQSLVNERIQIPAIGMYTFQFSVGDAYAWVVNRADKTIKQQMPDSILDWTDPSNPYDLMYPTFYRSPYKRENYIQAGVRRIPKSEIRWHGTAPKDDHIDWSNGSAHQGESHATTTEPYCSYGLDDCDIVADRGTTPYGEAIIVSANEKNAFYLDKFYPFDVDPVTYPDGIQSPEPVPTDWQNTEGNYDIGKLFTTGYTGHHVGKINVEPGRTYYLTTRVTNKPFPDVDWENRLNPAYQAFYASGALKKSKVNAILAYAIVARKYDTTYNRWYYEMVDYKQASDTNIATDLFMEEIKIPEAIFPEEYVSTDDSNWENTPHLELWFSCDQCYLNGCANLDPSAGPVGYEPELYILDKDVQSSDSQSKTDYQNKVTVAPLQRPKNSDGTNNKDPRTDDSSYSDNFGFPYEYIVNREMYEKYGPIVKRSEYSNATTPEKLMEYANIEILSMLDDPSFEVSAADLRACGVSDCDTFRLLQKIKIDTEPHGVDQRVTLTKISMDLADLSSNQYTFGYEPTSDLSTMKEGGES